LGIAAKFPGCPDEIEREQKLGQGAGCVVEMGAPFFGQALAQLWRRETHRQPDEDAATGGRPNRGLVGPRRAQPSDDGRELPRQERMHQVHTIPPIIGWRARSSFWARFAPSAV